MSEQPWSAHDPAREVRMFGGLSFMVIDRMVVAVRGDDELLVRADPARGAQRIYQALRDRGYATSTGPQARDDA